jgi:alpha-L-fucosidase
MKRLRLGIFCSLFLLMFMNAVGMAAQDPAREARMAWWRQARFGFMMHWGLYSVPAGEWSGLEKQMDLWAEWIMYRARIPVAEYEPIAGQFNPVKFDARAWASLAHRAGMRYMEITAKHCDGFAMFRSQASKYNVVDATPFHRDPMAELAEACPRENVRLGFYYSHWWDWHEADALGKDNYWDFPDSAHKDPDRYLRSKSLPQVAELVNQYHPAVLFFDVPGTITREQSQAFVDEIRRVTPECIINDRVGNGLGDYTTPEQFIPNRAPGGDFEVCMTLNDHWGYDKNDSNWKPAPVVIHNLVHTASMGGNYMLNVGPTAEGEFPPEAVRILTRVGQWMDVNGESIYGTSACPLGPLAWGYCTAKAQRLYLHVLAWPARGRLLVPGLHNRPRRAWMLADQQQAALPVHRLGAEDLEIALPAQATDAIDTVIALDLDGEPASDSTQVLFPQPGSENVFGAGSASIHGKDAPYQGRSLAQREYDVVTGWSDPQTWIGWRFRAIRAGTYQVLITYSAQDGSEFSATVGPHTLHARVEGTGADRFDTFMLGTVNLQPGAYELAIKPEKLPAGSHLFDFHAITLLPAPESGASAR